MISTKNYMKLLSVSEHLEQNKQDDEDLSITIFERITRYNDNKGFNLTDPEEILVIKQGRNEVVLEKAHKAAVLRWLNNGETKS